MDSRMGRRVLVSTALILSFTFWSCEGGTGPDPETDPGDNLIGASGGEVVFQNLTLTVPPGALAEEVEITVHPLQLTPDEPLGGYVLVEGTAFDLGPDGLMFRQPALLTLGYDPSNVPDGIAVSELGLLRMDDGTASLASTVDAGAHEVRAEIDHFSSFAVGAPESPFELVDCPALSPAALAGVPLDRVALGTVPEELEPPLFARVEAEQGTAVGAALVPVGEAGAAELVVPLHPAAEPAGGVVRLTITDGTLGCAPFTFTIEPLEPAPGELDVIVGLMQEILTAQAAVFGTTPEEILSTPVEELPPALYPLALAQSTLADPDNPASLQSIALGNSPDAAEARLDLVEPLLARSGLGDGLSSVAAALQRPVSAVWARPPAGGPVGSIETGLCTPDHVKNAEQLDHCMGLARDAAFEFGNPTGQIVQDLAASLGTLGLVPGAGTASGIAGFATWLFLNQHQKNAALLPSFLTGMALDPLPVEFLEDQEGPGTWTASVTASNSDWDMGKDLLEGIFQSAQIAGTFDKAQIAGPELHAVLGYILNGPVADHLLSNASIDEYIMQAQDFGPVPVTEEAWTTSRIATGSAVVKTAHDQYEPRERGTATLAVRTVEGAFGRQQGTANAEITVKELQLNVSPDEIHLRPGESQSFNFTVTDSRYPAMVGLHPDVSLQGTIEEIIHVGDGLHIVSYTAPEEPDPDQADLLTLRHTAETGAREHSIEDRKATATIRFGRITISPRGGCVDPGNTLQFSAEVEGLEDEAVAWSVDAGQIDANGLYTAPDPAPASAVAVIRAQSVEQPKLEDAVTISIDCSCVWTAQTGSATVVASGGDEAVVQPVLNTSGNLTDIFGFDLSDIDGGGVVQIRLTSPLPVGSTGSFQTAYVLSGAGTMSPGAANEVFASDPASPMEINVDIHDGETFKASLAGPVTIVHLDGSETVTTFSASADIHYGGSPLYMCVTGGG